MNKIFVLSCFTYCFSFVVNAQTFTYEKNEEGVLVKESGEKVFFYQAKTKSKDGTYARADYIHPLWGLDGFVLTEDFPEDHFHHRGIFWTWHRVSIGGIQMGDAWECRDFAWNVSETDVKNSDDGSLRLEAKTYWESPLWLDGEGKTIPFAEERTKITVFPKQENYRIIDFEISLLALEPELTIAGSDDAKGYGGFSVRMPLPEDITFVSENGPVQPITNQLEAGPWMDISATLTNDGGKAGIVIICDPDNPVYPDPWILRTKENKSMQNPAYPGRLPVLISEKRPLVLRYRLLVYKGELSADDINSIASPAD